MLDNVFFINICMISKKNFVIKTIIFSNILIKYNFFRSNKNVEVVIKKLYIKDGNNENLCFLRKNYQLTVEKEDFLDFADRAHARKVFSNRFDILEENLLTNLKKSKNFVWAREQHAKTKTQQNSKTYREVEMLERWVSVLNYCNLLQFSLYNKDNLCYRDSCFKAMLGALKVYDGNNKIEFTDLDIIEKMFENRDINNFYNFIHDKIGVEGKYQHFPDPKCLKNKIRFNYLDDWKGNLEFQESSSFLNANCNRVFLESMAKFDKLQDSNVVIKYLEWEIDGEVFSIKDYALSFWETESFLLFCSKLATGYINHVRSTHPK